MALSAMSIVSPAAARRIARGGWPNERRKAGARRLLVVDDAEWAPA
jgi:hypothetical protein